MAIAIDPITGEEYVTYDSSDFQPSILQGFNPTPIQSKQDRLSQRTAAKQDKFKPAIVDIVSDGDGLLIRGNTLQDREFGIDAYEVSHGDNAYADTKSGRAKYDRQKAQIALEENKPVASVTDEMVRLRGMNQRFDRLASLNTNADGSMQKDLISVTRNADSTGNIFGTADKPLGLDVLRNDSGNLDHYNTRHMSVVKSLDGETGADVVGDKAILDKYGDDMTARFGSPFDTDPYAQTQTKYSDEEKAKFILPDVASSDDGIWDSAVGIGRAGVGGVLNVASSVASSPKKLYEFLGGDYLEDNSLYSKAVKGIIDTMDDGAKVITNINDGYIDNDKSNRTELEHKISESIDDGNYFTGIVGAIIDNPVGAIEFGASSYAFSKALTSAGITKIPGLLAATTDNVDEATKEFIKVNGREPDNSEKGIIAALSVLSTGVDSAAAGVVFKGAKANKITEGISDLVDAGIDKLPLQTVQQLITKPMVHALGRMAVEGIQEGPLQEGLKQLAANQNDVSKVTDPEALKAIYKQGIIGAISAPGMQATSAAVETGKAVGSKVLSKDGREEIVTNTKAAAEEVVARNKEAKTVTEQQPLSDQASAINEANVMSDTESYESTTPVVQRTPEEYAAALKEVHAADVSNGDTVYDAESLDEATTPELQELSKYFDDAYADAVETFGPMADQLDEAAKEETAAGVPVTDHIPSLRENSKGGIEQFSALREELVKANAGPKKLAVVDKLISNLIPLTTTKSIDELRSIVKDVEKEYTTDEKVSAVLGSSNAALEDVEAVIKQATESKDANPKQLKLLKLKAEGLKLSLEDVRTQKLVGGGSRPGMYQWASVLANGQVTEVAEDHINKFVEGQRGKLNTINEELEDNDVVNGIYGKDGKAGTANYLVDGERGRAFTKETFDALTPNQKADVRRHAKDVQGASYIKGNFTIAGKNYDVLSAGDLDAAITQEQVLLDTLQSLTTDTTSNTSQKVPTEPVKTQTPETEVSVQEEDTEAPENSRGRPENLKENEPTGVINGLDSTKTYPKEELVDTVEKLLKKELTYSPAAQQLQANNKKAFNDIAVKLKNKSNVVPESQKQPSKPLKEESKATSPVKETNPSEAPNKSNYTKYDVVPAEVTKPDLFRKRAITRKKALDEIDILNARGLSTGEAMDKQVSIVGKYTRLLEAVIDKQVKKKPRKATGFAKNNSDVANDSDTTKTVEEKLEIARKLNKKSVVGTDRFKQDLQEDLDQQDLMEEVSTAVSEFNTTNPESELTNSKEFMEADYKEQLQMIKDEVAKSAQNYKGSDILSQLEKTEEEYVLPAEQASEEKALSDLDEIIKNNPALASIFDESCKR